MIRRKITWTSQPQSPVGIDRSLIPFRLSTLIIGSELFNRATSTPVTLGSGVSRIYTSAGSVLTTSSRGVVDNYIHLDRSPPSGGLTVIAIARRHSSYGSGAIDFLWNTNNSSYTIGANINLSNAWAGAGNENKLGGFGSLYLDGVKQAGGASDVALVNNQYYNIVCRTSSYTAGAEATYLGANTNALFSTDIDCALLCVIEGDIGDSLAREISRNPWRLFAPQDRKVFVSVAGGGITGTFSVTESADVPAISGLVNHTGSLVVTESSDITSISGSIAHTGTLSVTESSDTFAASGTVSGSATITGSLALTEISDTASLIGKVAHTGALGVAETADTVSFNGLVAHTGALAVTESADVVAITGGSQITITGSIAITESPDVANFRGPSGNTFSQEVEFRKFYVRKGKKILLFDSVDEAEEYIKAEQVAEEAIAKAKVSSRQERRKIKKRIIKDVLPAESIDTDWLAEMMQRFAINFDLPKLLAEQDYNRVMEIHAMAKAMQDDEDDIEMLLMWG